MNTERGQTPGLPKTRRALSGLFAILVVCEAYPLPTDRDQPLKITADSAVRDDNAGETRYIGDVALTQGSLTIRADLLTIRHSQASADVVVAEGDPATLSQVPELGKQPVNAQAQQIEYHRLDDKIILRDGARIEQDGAIVTGAVIDYLITRQKVSAMSTKQNATSDQSERPKQRVEVIIPPGALGPEER